MIKVKMSTDKIKIVIDKKAYFFRVAQIVCTFTTNNQNQNGKIQILYEI